MATGAMGENRFKIADFLHSARCTPIMAGTRPGTDKSGVKSTCDAPFGRHPSQGPSNRQNTKLLQVPGPCSDEAPRYTMELLQARHIPSRRWSHKCTAQRIGRHRPQFTRSCCMSPPPPPQDTTATIIFGFLGHRVSFRWGGGGQGLCNIHVPIQWQCRRAPSTFHGRRHCGVHGFIQALTASQTRVCVKESERGNGGGGLA